MELGYILAIVYWVGYVIVFTIVLAISAWALTNKEEEEFNIFGMLLGLITIPIFSWIYIIFLILYYYFTNRKQIN